MATRKRGPVKPPTLDLTARKNPASKTSSRKPRARTAAGKPTAKPASEKPGANAPDKEPAADKPQVEKPADAGPASTTTSNTTSPGTTEGKSGLWPPSLLVDFTLTPLIAALLGIVGGAALGALLVIALLATGLLRPLLAQPQDPAIAELTTRITVNQEGISESLVGFRALNEQVSALNRIVDQQTSALQSGLEAQREQTSATLEQLSTQQAALEGQLQTL
ncbi:MAG TPA: hypothetical protein ENJ90_04980, partial [Devosia sp.]|nr:hypothetical protein [Devosia sp.]